MTEAVRAFWENNIALDYITPIDARWAEDYDVFSTLRELITVENVLDFGCGDGRMTLAFDKHRYIGVDINGHAIKYCSAMYSGYEFRLVTEVLPLTDVVLCYAVLLHVSDEEIASTVSRLARAAPRVVVIEILGRNWRGPGSPPVFNREFDDYVNIFQTAGMTVYSVATRPYNRYGTVPISIMDFRRCLL